MINKLLTGIFKLIISLVTVIMTPIDNLISSLLPSLSTALNGVNAFLNLITRSIGWVISLTGLSSETLSVIVLYFTFKLTAPLMFYLIKQAVKWYNALKP